MPKPTRFPFGFALGFENQFNNYGKGGIGSQAAGQQYEQVTAGLLAQASTAPDISFGSLFYTNNSSNTTITNFTQTWTGRAGGLTAAGQTDTSGPPPEGKIITVVFLDNSTQLANNSNLILAGSNNLLGANNAITLLGSNGKWIEMARSYNNTTEVTTFVTNAQSSLNMNGVRVAILNNTGSTTNKIIGLSGGQIGQEVSFMLLGSNPVMMIAQAGGATSSNMVLVTTNSMLINASGLYKFMKHTDLTWRSIAIGSANWSL